MGTSKTSIDPTKTIRFNLARIRKSLFLKRLIPVFHGSHYSEYMNNGSKVQVVLGIWPFVQQPFRLGDCTDQGGFITGPWSSSHHSVSPGHVTVISNVPAGFPQAKFMERLEVMVTCGPCLMMAPGTTGIVAKWHGHVMLHFTSVSISNGNSHLNYYCNVRITCIFVMQLLKNSQFSVDLPVFVLLHVENSWNLVFISHCTKKYN